MSTAVQILTSVSEGLPVPGLSFPGGGKGFAASLEGCLDMGCVASMGHSFGGGSSCAVPAEADSVFKCGIGLDPYWYRWLSQLHAGFAKAIK